MTTPKTAALLIVTLALFGATTGARADDQIPWDQLPPGATPGNPPGMPLPPGQQQPQPQPDQAAQPAKPKVNMTAGGDVVAGSAGAGAEGTFTITAPNLYNGKRIDVDASGNASLGLMSGQPGHVAAVGNLGWVLRVTPKNSSGFGFMVASDPMIAHSDGVRTVVGADPVAGLGATYKSDRAQVTLSPKLVSVTDNRTGRTADGVGGQATFDLLFSDKFKGNAFAVLTSLGGGSYAAAGAGVQYMLKPDLALNAGMEISDLAGAKDLAGCADLPGGPALLTKIGISKAF